MEAQLTMPSGASLSTVEIKSRIGEGYNKMAEQYLEWNKPFSKVVEEHLAILMKSLETIPHPVALEVGCGAGVPGTKMLSSHPGIKVIANDISSKQIDLARTNVDNSRVKFVLKDMVELGFDDASFDAVTAIYSIFHLPAEEQREMIKRIYGWLKPNGRFLCCFATEDDKVIEGEFLGSWMFWSSLGTNSTLQELEATGFTIESQRVVVHAENPNGKGLVEVSFLWVIAKKP